LVGAKSATIIEATPLFPVHASSFACSLDKREFGSFFDRRRFAITDVSDACQPLRGERQLDKVIATSAIVEPNERCPISLQLHPGDAEPECLCKLPASGEALFSIRRVELCFCGPEPSD
jgi:hypothetical protein